jgi:circadian clock protein KaiC
VAIERITTGIPELDDVLMGGIPAHSINVIMGAPGTGKTILAEQIVFANATPKRPALFLSTLSEPLEKFIVHGQTFGFFDPAKVGESVFYEDLGVILRQRGITSLPAVMSELITRHRPGVIVIDSFKALNALGRDVEDRRLTIFDLASVLSTFECTSFLIGEYGPETVAELPEFAIADGVIQLMKYQTGMREQRFLRVEKLRGSDAIPGMHAFRIGPDGLKVSPRLLTPELSPSYSDSVERVSTGISGLDEMIEKGFWRGSTTLLAGPSGSGKTAISLHFIQSGAERGEPGLYVGFQENPVQLKRTLANFGWSPESTGKNFQHLYNSPVEMQLDEVVLEIFRRVRNRSVRRVVIDAIGDLKRSSFDHTRFTEYMYSLTQWLAVAQVTCLLTYETTQLFGPSRLSDEEISNMSDNILLLQLSAGPRTHRTLRIIKTRNSGHDNRERILRITSRGASIEGEASPEEADS